MASLQAQPLRLGYGPCQLNRMYFFKLSIFFLTDKYFTQTYFKDKNPIWKR